MANAPNASVPAVWRLHDAKAQFSLVVDLALRGIPQHVSKRGKQAVVVLSEQDYLAMQRSVKAQAPGFVGHLLTMPKSPPAKPGTAVRALAPIRKKPARRASLSLRHVKF